MKSSFFSEVVKHIPQDIQTVVVVTHLVPGVDDFLHALNRQVRVAAVIPKPNSINPQIRDAVATEMAILPYTRERIKSRPMAFLQDLKELVGDDRLAIIDTGGYFSHVLFEMVGCGEFNLVGVVEDTENGHQKYERLLKVEGGYSQYPCPVISVARSPLKDPEDFLVGQAVVFSADALVRECGLILNSKRALVMGYGKIGSSIAANLRAKGVRVDIYDTNPVRQALAYAHGFGSGSRHELLKSADIIFCATGNKSLKPEDFALCKDRAFIFTATSGDDEIENYRQVYQSRLPLEGNARISQIKSGDGAVYLCNDGNSANFMHGGVVGPFIKLVQAELIFALSQFSSVQCDRVRQLNDCSKRFIADTWLNNFSPA